VAHARKPGGEPLISVIKVMGHIAVTSAFWPGGYVRDS
jgi:hypothetical protein